MNKYQFQLNNLTNDKPMALLFQVNSRDIELACKLHNITKENIGIEIVELEEDV